MRGALRGSLGLRDAALFRSREHAMGLKTSIPIGQRPRTLEQVGC
jgi:hypothetical protein